MDGAEAEARARANAYDGSDFIITRRRWRHVVNRHPELEGLQDAVLQVAASPDEAYVDLRGRVHLLKASREAPSDFLVVIARKEAQKTYLVTAYSMGSKRKKRGYRAFKKLPL